jgi:ketosteroid isomerase-like protein
MRAKLPYLVGGVVALLIALRIGIHFATPPPVNPQERIRQMFAEGKQAFEREDVNALMAMVADDFEWGGLNKEQLRYQLANFFKNVQALRAEYTPPLIEVRGDRAVARTEVHVVWNDAAPESQSAGPLLIEFRRERKRKWLIIPYEEWKVVKIQGLEPVWME